jgi:diguanylate cyclase (GGDEF)-like protein/PAS domain S-box-containing protein
VIALEASPALRSLVVHEGAGPRRELAEMLRRRGHAVLACGDVASALAAHAADPFALVVLQDDLSEASGEEICAQVRDLGGSRMPVLLALVPPGEPERAVGALAAGFDDLVTWPESEAELALRFEVAERRAGRRADRRGEHERLRELEKAVETMQLGVTITDPQRRIIYTNLADATMHGWQPAELIGQDVRVFAPKNAWRDLEPRRLHSLSRWKRESLNARRDGSVFPVQVTSDLVRDAAGRPVAIVTCCEDISERKAAEEALRESEERYALAARGAQDALWDWDLRRDEVYFSARWREMLGLGEEPASDEPQPARRPDVWLQRIHPADRQQVEEELARHLRGESGHFESGHRLLHQDGSYRWVLVRGLAVRDEAGRACRMAGSLSDLTGRGVHDPLTGLPNRAFFMSRLGSALERWRRDHEERFAVLLLDIDRFKLINDSLGPAAGDQLLLELAARFEESLRASGSLIRLDGTLSRAGGDEFLVLLEGIRDAADALRVTERLEASLRPALTINGGELFTSASIGIALSGPSYGSAEELIRDAEIAMHRAKALGGARFQVFDKEMHEQALARLRVENELRRALERDELRVHYQPIVDLESGLMTGLEALVRWQHPEEELLPPERFIPLAEESDLILAVDRWVLERVCREMQRLRGAVGDGKGLELHVSVNLSGRHFSQAQVVTHVRDTLAHVGLPAGALKLEVTEGTLMANPELAQRLLGELKELGVEVCLDDFGTGYSSLSYLNRFPIDVVKVDRSFVAGLGIGGGEQRIVETIVRLARQLDLQVIAEGVETEQQRDSLMAMGCTHGQGFYFAPPMPWEQVLDLVSTPLPVSGV